MAIVNKVDLKLKVSLDTTIKYQILTYCFFKDIVISNSDLEFLAVLAKADKGMDILLDIKLATRKANINPIIPIKAKDLVVDLKTKIRLSEQRSLVLCKL